MRPDLFGIFHDCGIPLMLQKVAGHKELLAKANAGQDHCLTQLEPKACQIDHTTVSHFVGRPRGIPDHLCHAIHSHHDRELFRAGLVDDSRILSLVALLKVASHLGHTIRDLQDANDWEFMQFDVLQYLGISPQEFHEIATEVRENSSATPQAWINKFAAS